MNSPQDLKRAQEDAIRRATHRLVALLLVTPPYLPSSVKSKQVIQRHSFLGSSPEDPGEYLVTDCYPSAHQHTASKSIELLRDFASQVEQSQLIDSTLHLEDLVTDYRYQCCDNDSLLVAVNLGKKGLSMLMRIEGSEMDTDSYKFDNLLPSDVLPGKWRREWTEASLVQRRSGVDVRMSSVGDNRDPSTTDTSLLQGDYYTDPKDFWEGVQDETDGVALEGEEREGRKAGAQRAEEEKEEERYWALYDDDRPVQDVSQHGRKSGYDVSRQERSSGMELSKQESVKMILKGAFHLLRGHQESGLEGSDNTAHIFLQLSQDVVQECVTGQ